MRHTRCTLGLLLTFLVLPSACGSQGSRGGCSRDEARTSTAAEEAASQTPALRTCESAKAGVADAGERCRAPGTASWVAQADHARSGDGLAVAADGSIVVVGTFWEDATFGAGERARMTLSADTNGELDIFVAKYTAHGLLAWARRVGGRRTDRPSGVGLTSLGDVVVSGHGFDRITFGARDGPDAMVRLDDDDAPSAFLVRYDENGHFLGARHVDLPVGSIRGLAVQADGSSVATVDFRGRWQPDPGWQDARALASEGGTDIFVACFDAQGAPVWATRAGSHLEREVGNAAIALVDGGGGVAGRFAGSASFGPQGDHESLASSGLEDAFLARYDAQGRLLWARKGGGPGFDDAQAVAARPNGTLVVTGRLGLEPVAQPGDTPCFQMDASR